MTPESGTTGVLVESELMEVLIAAAESLVGEFDLVEFLHTLSSNAAAVGLVLADHQDRVRYMASSTEEGRMLELLHLQNDDGPGLDAITSGSPVVNADLAEATTRWPLFAPAARAAGLRSVHAFPLKLRDEIIGALTIFGTEPARFARAEVRMVQALADVATIALVQERSRHQAELVTAQLEMALNSRIVIEQAKGALARSQDITVGEAFEVMLTTARLSGRRLSDVAQFVLTDLGPPLR